MSGCKMIMPTGDEYDLQPIVCTQRAAWGAPRNVSVKDGGLRSAELSWQAPEASVYRYRIERSETPDGPYAWVVDVPGKRLAFVDGQRADKRLKDSTTYYYKVYTVIDKKGLMSESAPPVKTVTAGLPVAPSGLQAEASGSRAVTLTWNAPASEGIVAYKLQRTLAEQSDHFEEVGTATTVKWVDGGTSYATLKDSTKYLYRVVAINRVEAESAPSEAVSVVTMPPPQAPRKLVAVANQVRCVPLSWEPSPEADVVRYDIYQARSAAGPFNHVGTVNGRTTTTFIDGGANPGKLEDEGVYFYCVRAVNAVTAESVDSEVVRSATRAVPPTVAQVTPVGGKPREIPISWVASPDDSVTGYELWRSRADDDEWTQITRFNSRGETNYLDRGGQNDPVKLGLLEDSTEYWYRVVAFNTANVRSSASVPVNARTKVIPVPPAGLKTTTQVARGIQLVWEPNPEKDVNGYLVEISKKPDSGFKKLTQIQGDNLKLAAEDVNLDPGVTKYFRVKALDREGIESLWSEVIQGTSKPLPDAPTNVRVAVAGNSFNVSWTPPAQKDVVQYKVYIKKTMSWELLTTTEQPMFSVPQSDVLKPMTYAVAAVDKDNLEGARSEPVKVELKLP